MSLPDYHLIQRKRKRGTVLYAGIIADAVSGRKSYAKMIPLQTAPAGDGKRDRERRDREAYAELLELHAAGKLSDSSKLADYLIEFWTYETSPYVKAKKRRTGRNISPKYVNNNLGWIKRYFLPYMAHRRVESLSDLSKKVLWDWMEHLAEHGRLKLPGEVLETDADGKPIEPGTISPTTINKVRQAVHVALEHADKLDLIPLNPMSAVEKLRETPNDRKPYQIAELRKLFSAPWSDIRSFTACMLAASTGLRLGEVRGFRLFNLHLRDGYLDVTENYQDGEGLKPPKWGHDRRGVPVPDMVVTAIVAMLRTYPWKPVKKTSYVFYGNAPGEPVPKHMFSRHLKERCKVVGIPYRDFHSLRQTAASIYAERAGIDTVRRILGHTTEKMTEHYITATEETRSAFSDIQNKVWSDQDGDRRHVQDGGETP